MVRLLVVLAWLAALVGPALAQDDPLVVTSCGTVPAGIYVPGATGRVTVDINGNTCGSSTASVSIAGFTPNGSFSTPLSVSNSSANVALPSGAVALVQNVGANNAYVVLETGTGTSATTSDILVPAGGALAFTVGANDHLAAITSSSTTTLNIAGGSGIFSGIGGTSSSGGGGGTSSNFAATFPAAGTAIGVKAGANMVNLTADGSNNLNVDIAAGAVTANAGTNLNTSALALEGGGNLATTATNTGTIAGAITAGVNQVNLKQVNGIPTSTGAGATGTGTQRVGVAQDTTTIAGSAPGTAGSASTNVVTVQGIASGTNLAVSQATASALNATVVGSGTAGTPAGGVLTVQGSASGTALPVSAASLPLPTNAAQETGGNLATIATNTGTTATNTGTTATNTGTIAGAVTSSVMQVNTKQVNGVTTLAGAGAVGTGAQRVAVGQDTTTIAGSAPGTAGSASTNVLTVQGIASGTNIPVSQATAANLNATVVGAGTAGSASGGVLTVQGSASGTAIPVSLGSTPLPTGAATAANQTNVQGSVGAGTAPADMNVDGQVYNSTAPGPSNGQSLALQSDAKGNLRTGNPAITAAAATATTIVTGGTAVTTITGPVNGCIINNPLTATGQGVATAESLFINFVGAATTTEGGNVFALQPGQPFTCPGGFTGNISADAATSSHKFSAVVW